MATLPSLLTPRDQDILAGLDRCPLTTRQFLALSETFTQPFGSERRVRQRLQTLAEHGFVRRWQFAAVGQGTLNYYTLSPLGFQLLYGVEEPLPSAKVFRAIGSSRLAHTHALADFLVHTLVAAHHSSIQFSGFYRENALRLIVGGENLYPDSAFQLVTPDQQAFSFFVELDNATERLRSERSLDSWERKLRFYESFQDQCAKRFRVLVVTTGTADRLHHILALASQLARNPVRSLLYGVTLKRYLEAKDPVVCPCFLDHRFRPVPLVSPRKKDSPVLVPTVPHPSLTAVQRR